MARNKYYQALDSRAALKTFVGRDRRTFSKAERLTYEYHQAVVRGHVGSGSGFLRDVERQMRAITQQNTRSKTGGKHHSNKQPRHLDGRFKLAKATALKGGFSTFLGLA